jgi:hypothetical protein
MSLRTQPLRKSVPSVNQNTLIKLDIRQVVDGESLITYAQIAVEERITINDTLIVMRTMANYIIMSDYR